MRNEQAHIADSRARLRWHLALGTLLVLATVLSGMLKLGHTYLNGRPGYNFLPFNLFLAWIPFVAAVMAYLARKHRLTFFLVMPVCTLVWLAFFPNAAYLLTDFQHLAVDSSRAPLWYDVILLIWYAWTGLLLGISSLYLMQAIVTELFSRWFGWLFAIAATVLSSLGIYLGRFLRWNSWDLLYDPIPIARDMADIVRNPLSNLPTYVFTILFTLLFLFIYVTIHVLGHLMRSPRGERITEQDA